MAISPVNLGAAADDGTGDSIRDAFAKCNKAIAGYTAGTTHAWSDPDWQAAMADFTRYFQFASGLNSTAANGSAPTAISVGASPFTWTNAGAALAQVFVSGAVDDMAVNGSSVGADVRTVLLQAGESVTVSYSSGTPAMNFKVA